MKNNISDFKINSFAQAVYFSNNQRTRYVFKISSIGEEYDYKTSKPYIVLYDGEWDHYNDEPVYYDLKDCEPWVPEKGEFCWFWDNDKNISHPRKFDKMDETNPKLYQPEESVMGFKFCEPFFGTLPSPLDNTD
jgi:hypothetical protein